MDESQLLIVAFVQDDITREILQTQVYHLGK
jgi:hypothetical protein